ncbi:classical arabinogalactan protein 9-like [Salvia hispanica]|uniref:classical arabinogalactan protein 9-like n=1 Tax=Salvia hispanica TaxID=49212 RepID=UPI0020095038|nr:classical arabinogalactan protein 9-like [Salvia hispanica]
MVKLKHDPSLYYFSPLLPLRHHFLPHHHRINSMGLRTLTSNIYTHPPSLASSSQVLNLHSPLRTLAGAFSSKMASNLLLFAAVICIAAAAVNGQSPTNSPAPPTPTTPAPPTPTPPTATPPPATTTPPPAATPAPLASPPALVLAAAPSKPTSPAPSPLLSSPPSPPTGAPGPSLPGLSPAPSATDQSGANPVGVAQMVSGSAILGWALMFLVWA